MPTVFVTGATGLPGNDRVRLLLSEGVDVLFDAAANFRDSYHGGSHWENLHRCEEDVYYRSNIQADTAVNQLLKTRQQDTNFCGTNNSRFFGSQITGHCFWQLFYCRRARCGPGRIASSA